MSDPIEPPAARRPEEALELAAQALSDGDLEAALAQYEPGARLVTWLTASTGADGEPGGRGPGHGREPGGGGGPGRGGGGLRGALAGFMALRLPLAVQVGAVLRAPGLALVLCERHTAGTAPDGEEVKYRGNGCAVVRAQPDGTWRIAADAWHPGTGTLL